MNAHPSNYDRRARAPERALTPYESLGVLRTALKHRPSFHNRDLRGADPKKPSRYRTHTQTPPIAESTHPWSNTTESLTQLLLIGGHTVLGVSRVRSREGSDGSRDVVRVMLLPMGGNTANYESSSRTLATVRLSDLKNPGADGVVHPWRTISLGRTHPEQGFTDSLVSREHATITIGDEGSLIIDDTSSNGTSVVEALDLSPLHSGLGEDGQTALATIAQSLHNNPHVWTQNSPDLSA